MLIRVTGVLALLVAAPANAQFARTMPDSSQHVETIDYSEGEVVPVRAAVGYQLMVELAADEQVKNIAIGDSGPWQINVGKEGDRLFLKPIRPAERTNMTVVTSVRTYHFDLESLAELAADTPYTIVFRYAAPRSSPDDSEYVDVSAATRRLTKYRISGDPALRPEAVSDDGRHTYVAWPRDASIPAIYSIDAYGKETLVNGMMGTDDVYVVDGVPRVLMFRIDRASARAERIFPQRSRR
jgi:type IV secretion system protein VirB9